MRKFVLVCAGLMMAAAPAFAAKVHREGKKTLEPKAKTAASDIKAACGCAPTVTVDWKSFDATKAEKADDYRRNIEREFDNASKTAKEFCNDADSKKLFCANVKKIVIFSKGVSEADATHDERSKTMSIYTSEQMNSGGYKMKSIMESW